MNELALQPLEGLAEIEVAEGNFSQAIRTYTKLVILAGTLVVRRIGHWILRT